MNLQNFSKLGDHSYNILTILL